MSIYITEAQKMRFNSGFQLLAQQMGSMLRRGVRVEVGPFGKKEFFDQIGKVTATKRVSRHADVIYTNTPHARRMVTFADWEVADLIDEQDKLRTIDDPAGPYLQAQAAGLGRSMDIELVTQMTATAYTGEDGTGTESFPTSSNQIAVNFVDSGSAANSNLTIAKLRKAKEVLDDADFPAEGRFCAVTGSGLRGLLRDTTYTSADYNQIRALVAGEPVPFLGFDYIRVSPDILYKSGNNRSVLCWQMDSVLLAVAKDVTASLDVLPQKSHAVQALCKSSFGASRMQEKGVVEILCDETA